MNILVISQKYYPEPFRITDICETLVSYGHSVTAIVGLPNYGKGHIYEGYNDKKGKKEVVNGVTIIRCNEYPRGNNPFNLFLNFYSYYLSANKIIKRLKEDFDVVFINQLSPVMQAIPGLNYAKKHAKKVVLYCYDLWPASLAAGGIKEKSLIYKYYDIVSKKIYRNVDKLLITSKSFEKYLVNIHNIKKDVIEYLPQYCEDFYSMCNTKLNDKVYNYVFAGNIGKMQSVETIIKAANEIRNDQTIKIHIVGDGSNVEKCKTLAEHYGLENVVFYGRKPLSEMLQFYSFANAMILTLSSNELISYTLPGKVQSYLCAGKPIIASVNGEVQKLLIETKTGLCCDADDYMGLKDLFLKFKEVDYNEYSKNAINTYDSMFKKDVFFNKLIRILDSQISK